MANKVMLAIPINQKGTITKHVYCVVNGSGTGFVDNTPKTGQLFPPRNPK